MDDSDDFNEILNFDALVAAEKLTGKNYKEDEETMLIGFAMHSLSVARKKEELQLRGDTWFNMPYKDAVAVIESLGFELVQTRVGPADKGAPEYRVYWRAGVLLTAEAYTGWIGDHTPSVNDIQVYYNWKHAVDLDQRHGYTASGFYNTEAWDAGERIWIGNHNGREGLRHTLSQLEANGEFLPRWVQGWFTSLIPYWEKDFEKFEDRSKRRDELLAALPLEIRDCLAPE